MFLTLPFELGASAQQVLLVLNTVLLIVLLIAGEYMLGNASKEKRHIVRLFVPLLAVIGAILLYAVFKQQGGV